MRKSEPNRRNALKTGSGKRSRTLVAALLCAAVAAGSLLLYFAKRNDTGAQKAGVISAPQTADLRILNPSELFLRTVQRAYAVDKLFHRIYRPTWEGAIGAIGDAYLYAATGDQSLLSFYTTTRRLTDLENGTWLDDRAWACLAEMNWWNFTGRKNVKLVEDAKRRYDEAKKEGRFSHHEGFWSWYNYPPGAPGNFRVFTNTNMNQMATVACWLYEATREKQYYRDAQLVWDGDSLYPGIERMFYRGDGTWQGNEGLAAFGKQFPWDGAGVCPIGAALYRMTGNLKYKEIVAATAKRIMNPANGWVDPHDFYQLRMDGNGAFVNSVLDAYLIAPDDLPDVPGKVAAMLEHVWTNHGGTAAVTLHRLSDDGIRNGWNPFGGEDGYNVDEVGTIHAQGEAARAFGVFSYVLHEELRKNQH
jgi:hypothetical protein